MKHWYNRPTFHRNNNYVSATCRRISWGNLLVEYSFYTSTFHPLNSCNVVKASSAIFFLAPVQSFPSLAHKPVSRYASGDTLSRRRLLEAPSGQSGWEADPVEAVCCRQNGLTLLRIPCAFPAQQFHIIAARLSGSSVERKHAPLNL